MSVQIASLFDKGIIVNEAPHGQIVVIENNFSLVEQTASDGEKRYLVMQAPSMELRLVNLKGIIYIAGPMRSIEKHNFPAFDHAAQVLQAKGFITLNPADFDRQMGIGEDAGDVSNELLRRVMDRDLNAISRSTHIALLNGWEGSVGVKVEALLGKMLGLTFLAEADDFTKIVDPAAVGVVIGARLIGEYETDKPKLPE